MSKDNETSGAGTPAVNGGLTIDIRKAGTAFQLIENGNGGGQPGLIPALIENATEQNIKASLQTLAEKFGNIWQQFSETFIAPNIAKAVSGVKNQTAKFTDKFREENQKRYSEEMSKLREWFAGQIRSLLVEKDGDQERFDAEIEKAGSEYDEKRSEAKDEMDAAFSLVQKQCVRISGDPNAVGKIEKHDATEAKWWSWGIFGSLWIIEIPASVIIFQSGGTWLSGFAASVPILGILSTLMLLGGTYVKRILKFWSARLAFASYKDAFPKCEVRPFDLVEHVYGIGAFLMLLACSVGLAYYRYLELLANPKLGQILMILTYVLLVLAIAGLFLKAWKSEDYPKDELEEYFRLYDDYLAKKAIYDAIVRAEVNPLLDITEDVNDTIQLYLDQANGLMEKALQPMNDGLASVSWLGTLLEESDHAKSLFLRRGGNAITTLLQGVGLKLEKNPADLIAIEEIKGIFKPYVTEDDAAAKVLAEAQQFDFTIEIVDETITDFEAEIAAVKQRMIDEDEKTIAAKVAKEKEEEDKRIAEEARRKKEAAEEAVRNFTLPANLFD